MHEMPAAYSCQGESAANENPHSLGLEVQVKVHLHKGASAQNCISRLHGAAKILLGRDVVLPAFMHIPI